MAGAINIQIKGASEIIVKLQNVKNLGKLKPAMNKCLAIVEASAKTLCPVDSGALRSSIHVRPAKLTGKQLEGVVYTSKEYAMYVEFGTGKRGKGSFPYALDGALSYDSEWAGQIAQPYMTPALLNNRQAIEFILTNAVLDLAKGGK